MLSCPAGCVLQTVSATSNSVYHLQAQHLQILILVQLLHQNMQQVKYLLSLILLMQQTLNSSGSYQNKARILRGSTTI